MKKFITSLSFAVLASALFAQTAMASGESSCQIIYGGGQVCNTSAKFTINKLVQIPGKDYVDNLAVNDAHYSAAQTVNFKIVITNTGSTKISHTKVTDSFPQYLTYVSGQGNYNANAKTLSFDVNNLEAGKSQEFIISAKVATDDQLPQDKGVVCVVNQVNATEDNGATASDASQVCIERVVINTTAQVFQKVPVKNIPNTGPEMLPLIALIPAGLAGLKLRQKSKIN